MIKRQMKPSGDGIGKWETNRSLAKYRRKRNAANKKARKARLRNSR